MEIWEQTYAQTNDEMAAMRSLPAAYRERGKRVELEELSNRIELRDDDWGQVAAFVRLEGGLWALEYIGEDLWWSPYSKKTYPSLITAIRIVWDDAGGIFWS